MASDHQVEGSNPSGPFLNGFTFSKLHSFEFKRVKNTKSMKVYSPFRIGLALIVIASLWITILFSGSEKISSSTYLESKETSSLELNLDKSGIGFYILTVPDFSKDILFVQILDSNGSVIADKKITTKMSVNYFKFSHSGRYIMEITNISEKSVRIQADFGDTKASDLLIPVLISFLGTGIIIISGYRKLTSQNTAQPEENNS